MTATGRMQLRTLPCVVTVRTPVHIGSGAVLRKDADYIVEPAGAAKQVRVVDVERALTTLGREQLGSMQGGAVAAAVARGARERVTRHVLPYRGPDPGEIREQLALADGTPYLPGSSLKGALRTALLAAVLERRGGALPAVTGPDVEELALGALPNARPQNRDMLRLLRLSDFVPERPAGVLALLRLEARPLRPPAGRGRQGIPIWCEALAPGTWLRGTLTLERGSALEGALAADQREALDDYLGRIAAFAARVADFEHESYAAAASLAPPVIREIIAGHGRAGPEVWCNLGWGGGWHTKTVASVLPPDQRLAAAQRVRERFRAGGPVPSPFPSSRRVAFSEQGETPMGWVQLLVGGAGADDGR